MKIAIIGTGGVGGYFGGKLAKAGFDVTFFARGEHLSTLKNNGLLVKSILGDFHLANINATNRIQDIEVANIIILALKAWKIKELASNLKTILHKDSIILPLQNGVSTVDELTEYIDKKHILGGLCRIISKIEAPGIINHFGVDPEIVFGEIDKSKTERILKLKNILDKAEIKNKIADDIQADLWKKFIAICVSGLLAVSKTSYGELREIKETRQMMIDLIDEIYYLSKVMGISIEKEFPEKTLVYIDSFPYNSTSSLTRDVWEGKPSEIEYQNGTVVKLGEKYGVLTPVNRFIYNCILPMELKARNKK